MRFAIAVVLALVACGWAHAETCFKAGEEASGIGKVCTYRCNAGVETVNVGAASACPITAERGATGPGRGSRLDETRMGGSPGPAACFKQCERVSGMSKACIYTCSGTRRVTTVGAAQLCPLTPE
ncbi:MAG: hypothetical protein GC203_21035 [Phenylobacterium sp.]|uniref:hypothetical protein n=1 Tax=Phenylobacterium sp. TaxID=1871053 RepID=UPI0025FB33A8|nr:hypothetical protein [Phenylobacterium sp.]MBI1200352.1 hypothetical protein [Phenylobacterium sp.]